MDKSRLEMKVGLFVAIGLGLLAMLLVWFNRGASPFRGTYDLKLHAGNIGGLKQSSGVLLAGVGVGSVRDIKLDPSGTNVTITLQIYKDFPIYHDARFVIESANVLGDQYVSVVPTANTMPLLTNGEEVECQAPFNLQEVARGAAGFVNRLDQTAKKLDASVTDLRAQVLNEKTLSNFSAAVTNLRAITEQAKGTLNDINNIINTNGTQVDFAVSNLVMFSKQLNQFGDTAQDILATNGANLTGATKNLEEITANAQDLVKDIQAGKGVAGTLLTDNQTMTNLQLLAANLSIASSNLNRNGLWHFLWSHPPPSTNSSTPAPTHSNKRP